MQLMTQPFSPLGTEAYVAALEELTRELGRAITAVTTGALSDFEHSLVRQRISCTYLAELTKRHTATVAKPTSTIFACTDPLLVERTTAAISALDAATRHYSILLKHFGETARMFAGMFRTYGGPASSGTYLQKSQGAWSCEL